MTATRIAARCRPTAPTRHYPHAAAAGAATTDRVRLAWGAALGACLFLFLLFSALTGAQHNA